MTLAKAENSLPENDQALCLNVAQVAAHLGISENKARELVRTGEIPSFTVGTRRIISRISLEQWIRDQEALA